MSLIEEIINQHLANNENTAYTLLINNDVVLEESSSNPKLVKVVYKKEGFKHLPKIGYFTRQNKEIVFLESETQKAVVDAQLKANSFAGIDLTKYLANNNNVTVRVNHDFRILHILTPAYIVAKKVSLQNNNGGALYLNKVLMDLGTIARLEDTFTVYALTAYENVVSYVLLKKLKKFSSAKFYFLLDSYVPVNIYGDVDAFLFNPYMYLPKISDKFTKTFIFQLSNHTSIQFNSLTVGFLTPKEICQGFSLDRFVNMNLNFYLNLLNGCFSSDFFNPDTKIYVYKGNAEEDGYEPVLSEQAYKDNLSWTASNYLKMSTLDRLCIASWKALKVPKNQISTFRDIVKRRALKYVS